jgi:hypothetical protein
LRRISGDYRHDQLLRSAGQCRIHYAMLQASDMDTNGTPLLTLERRLFGSGGGAVLGFDRWTGRNAGGQTVGYRQDLLLTSKTRITGTAQANAATGAAGTVTLTVLYSVEG